MGQRANLAIMQAGKYTLFYDHWMANSLPTKLFWGPDFSLSMIRSMTQSSPSDWMDEIWCEGGCVMDLERKILTFFGGQDEVYEIPFRRVFLALMAHTWPGWTLNWAYEGIADLVRHVGFPVAKVLSNSELLPTALIPPDVMAPPPELNWTDIVVSLKSAEGERRFFPIAGTSEILYYGPGMLDIPRPDGCKVLDLAQLRNDFPIAGIHVDLATKTLGFWHADPIPEMTSRVARCWPDWKILNWRDRFESQLEMCGSSLQFPAVDQAGLLGRIRAMLLAPSAKPPLDLIVGDTAEFHTAQVNPDVFRFTTADYSHIPREDIVNEAISALLKSR